MHAVWLACMLNQCMLEWALGWQSWVAACARCTNDHHKPHTLAPGHEITLVILQA